MKNVAFIYKKLYYIAMSREINEYIKIKKEFFASTYKFDGVKSSLHFHNVYEVYYLEKGKRDHLINGKNYTARVGNFILIPPGVPHQTNGTAFQRRLLHFTKDILRTVLSEDYINKMLELFENIIYFSNPEDKSLLQNFFNDAEKAYMQNNAESFVITIANIFNYIKSLPTQKQQDTSNELINKIVDYIQENACSINSLDEIASKFYINKFYLCHLFKKEKQTTIISFLQNIKIQKAAHLLLTTNDKISEICYKTGFNSEYYFSKCFSSVLGISPSKYRSQFRNR